jgi:hypothetical protein
MPTAALSNSSTQRRGTRKRPRLAGSTPEAESADKSTTNKVSDWCINPPPKKKKTATTSTKGQETCQSSSPPKTSAQRKAAAEANKTRGRPFGDGIGNHRTEKYREKIRFKKCENYTFPKAPGTQSPVERRAAIANTTEVAKYVVRDFYLHQTGGIIPPADAPVDYAGLF